MAQKTKITETMPESCLDWAEPFLSREMKRGPLSHALVYGLRAKPPKQNTDKLMYAIKHLFSKEIKIYT